MFPVNKQEITTLSFTTTTPLATAEYADWQIQSNFFKKLPWVSGSFADGVLTLTVAPTEDVVVGKYTIQITSTDAQDEKYFTQYVLGVYENDPAELESVEIEKYLTVDEDNNTILRVTPAQCYYNADCGKNQVCFGGSCTDT